MILDTLITDRTEADVARWAYLNAKRFPDMTAEEQSEWLAGMKGAYNAADLNRVGLAVAYLAELLTGCGYTVAVSPKTDWAAADIPTLADLRHCLADLAAIRGVLTVPDATPAVPGQIWATNGANGLTVQKANDMEKILVDVEGIINTMATTFIPCGEAICGEDNL